MLTYSNIFAKKGDLVMGFESDNLIFKQKKSMVCPNFQSTFFFGDRSPNKKKRDENAGATQRGGGTMPTKFSRALDVRAVSFILYSGRFVFWGGWICGMCDSVCWDSDVLVDVFFWFLQSI